MADFLTTFGAAPRQTPQLQTWMTQLATYVDGELNTANLYHSASGLPTVPTSLDALFTTTPAVDTVVFWKDTATGFVYTYIYDASADQWTAGPNSATQSIPPGSLISFAGDGTAAAALSPDYLLCYGQAVSRATYADLFAVIGTTYGVGDGSTTFNMPDLRGRVPAGLDNMGGASANRITDSSADSIGGVYGAESITLTEAQMPVHDHNFVWNHTATGGTHIAKIASTDRADTATYNADQSVATAGSGNAHPNVQPSLFVNYLIKT